MATVLKIVGVLVWTVVSILLVWYSPLYVVLPYLAVCAVAYQVWKRRDARERAEALSGSDDTQRAESSPQRHTGPASKGFGAFSWGSHRDDQPSR